MYAFRRESAVQVTVAAVTSRIPWVTEKVYGLEVGVVRVIAYLPTLLVVVAVVEIGFVPRTDAAVIPDGNPLQL